MPSARLREVSRISFSQFCKSDTRPVLLTSPKASEIAGACLRAIAPAAGASANYTRRRIALRLLPFVIVFYITNYLDRTSAA